MISFFALGAGLFAITTWYRHGVKGYLRRRPLTLDLSKL